VEEGKETASRRQKATRWSQKRSVSWREKGKSIAHLNVKAPSVKGKVIGENVRAERERHAPASRENSRKNRGNCRANARRKKEKKKKGVTGWKNQGSPTLRKGGGGGGGGSIPPHFKKNIPLRKKIKGDPFKRGNGGGEKFLLQIVRITVSKVVEKKKPYLGGDSFWESPRRLFLKGGSLMRRGVTRRYPESSLGEGLFSLTGLAVQRGNVLKEGNPLSSLVGKGLLPLWRERGRSSA